MVLWLLRIALYLQVLLGLGRFFGLVTQQRLWETHITLGIVITILAIVALRPTARIPQDGVRRLARFVPLAPLALGLAMTFDLLNGRPLAIVLVHMALGLATVALVEMAAARQRRALRGVTLT
ncbi:MAG TPA: hypothetical protein VIN09_02385 [Chloroflexota bacterium]